MWFLIFVVMVLSFSNNINAMTDEEAKAMFTKIVMNCTAKHPVEVTELMNLQLLKPPTDHKTKCLLACAYRIEGSLNSKGMLDVDHANKYAEEMSNGDPKRLENGKKMTEICAKVNDEKVSDGEKGCDRAGLIFKCLVTQGPKFGFKM